MLSYAGGIKQLIGTTQLDGNDLLIVMDASKLLKYANVIGSLTGNTALKSLGNLLGSYNGMEVGNMTTTILSDDNPQLLLLQPVDSHDLEELETEVNTIRAHTDIPFRLVAVHIRKWNEELTPWPAPPVFGKIPFGDGAEGTLRELLSILEKQRQQLGWDPSASLRRVVLGGYSLAGLFALWAGTEEPFGHHAPVPFRARLPQFR